MAAVVLEVCACVQQTKTKRHTPTIHLMQGHTQTQTQTQTHTIAHLTSLCRGTRSLGNIAWTVGACTLENAWTESQVAVGSSSPTLPLQHAQEALARDQLLPRPPPPPSPRQPRNCATSDTPTSHFTITTATSTRSPTSDQPP